MNSSHPSYDQSSILATAIGWRSEGIPAIPIGPNKTPAIAQVVPYRTRWVPDEDLEAFIGDATGIAVLCGTQFRDDGLSLLVIDFDEAERYTAFCDTAEAAGGEITRLVADVCSGYVVRTPSGGVHLYILTPEPGKSIKLAQRPAPTKQDPRARKTLIETRARGGYAVTAPSHGNVHPSEQPYVAETGTPATAARLDPEQAQALLDFARVFDEMPRRDAQPGRKAVTVDGDRPGDRYNDKMGADGLLRLLTDAGWTVVRRAGDRTYVRRPGKDEGISGTVFGDGTPQFWLFSTSTAFDTERSYSAFGVYAVLEHDGDWSKAAKALVADGYGKRSYTRLQVTRRLGGKDADPGEPSADAEEPVDDDALPAIALSDSLLVAGNRFWVQEGFAPEALTNGVAWIEAYVQETLGPDLDVTRYRMRGRLMDGTELPPVDIETDDLSDIHRWPGRSGPQWSRFILEPGLAKRDQVRACIQLYSEYLGVKPIWRHSGTGWIEVDGQHVYRSHGCAIGPSGVRPDIEVVLDPGLQGYSLPAPPEPEALPDLGRGVLRMFDLAADRISVPLALASPRSILGEMLAGDRGIYLGGPTGSFKSALQGLATAQFGPRFATGRGAPLNFESTANSLEADLWRLKDAVAWVDDAAPESTRGHGEALFARIDRLARSGGNETARGRLTADARSKPAYPPRGLLLASGEDAPRGHSGTARLLVIAVTAGAVNREVLTECQRRAGAGEFAAFTAAFIQHVAARWDAIRAAVDRMFAEELEAAYQIDWGHPRTPALVAGYIVAGRCWVDFLAYVGAVTDIERAALVQRIRAGMLAAGQGQREALREVDPVTVFLEGVRSAMDGGFAHLLDRANNGEPPQAARFGWMVSTVNMGDHVEQVFRARGRPIGWVDLDEDVVHLDPTNALRLVNEVHGRAGVAIAHSSQALGQRLLDAHQLVTTDAGRATCRVYVGTGTARDRKRCWTLRLTTLFPPAESSDDSDRSHQSLHFVQERGAA